METVPITPAIGVEVRGVDASTPIHEEQAEQLRAAWVTHRLLVFRDQTLNPETQLAFTRLFGVVEKYPFLDGIPNHPLVAPVLKLPNEEVNFGGVWHSDTSYLETPAAGASLYAIDLPPLGGDTIFCNMTMAYRHLDAETRQQIASLDAINSSAKKAAAKTRIPRNGEDPDNRSVYSCSHPVVRTHPVTGEKSLYVNEAHTLRFAGWTRKDSEPLLTRLCLHARRPEFQCRLRWRKGTLIVWDNRSTHHYPVNDYHGQRRLLHRVSIRGERPV